MRSVTGNEIPIRGLSCVRDLEDARVCLNGLDSVDSSGSILYSVSAL